MKCVYSRASVKAPLPHSFPEEGWVLCPGPRPLSQALSSGLCFLFGPQLSPQKGLCLYLMLWSAWDRAPTFTSPTQEEASLTHTYMPMCPTPASPTPHHFWNSSCPLAGGSRVLMSQLNLICHLFLGDVQIGNSSIINEVLIALCNQFPRDAVWLLGWVFQHELPHLLRPGTWIRMMGHLTVSRVPSCPHRWAEQ